MILRILVVRDIFVLPIGKQWVRFWVQSFTRIFRNSRMNLFMRVWSFLKKKI